MNIIRSLRISGDASRMYEVSRWINPDIAPVPPSRRTWGYSSYFGFWGVAILSITNWQAAASLLSLGFSVGEAIGVTIIARTLSCALALAQGWMGAEWHIGYTVTQRMTLGMNGAYVAVAVRILMAITAYAVQAWLGGLAVSALLSSLSYSFAHMRDTISNPYLDTRDFIGFIIFQVISLPMILVPPHKARKSAAVGTGVSFFTMLSICIWATATGGTGSLVRHGGQFTLMSRAWAWLYGISSGVGIMTAGILNQADFTRFAKKQGVQVAGTAIALIGCGAIVPVFSIFTASATVNIYGGEPIWNPLILVQTWMKTYTPKSRAAAFFTSLAFVYAQLTENTYGNAYSAGIDLSAILPQYINIRRGSLICAALSFIVQPWLILNSSSTFLATISAFTLFLLPLIGMTLADYFIVRNQKVEISHLYKSDTDGAFWFTAGFNWRAIVVWTVCVAPAMPGMISSINPEVDVGTALSNYYRGNCIWGTGASIILYLLIVKFFPPPRAGNQDDTDVYGTFTDAEASKRGFVSFNSRDAAQKEDTVVGIEHVENN